MINVKISKKVFNDKYIPLLDDDNRYIVMYGGGSSGKSYFIVERYVKKLMQQKMNLLVVRQTGNTNRDSTYALFKQVINNWGVSSLFSITDLRIRCVNGNEVIFRGLDDVEKIKSTTFTNGELTDIWVEEATETQESDIQQLKVRLRGGTSKKQMVLSFNPININHWIKRHFIDGEVEKNVTVCHSTYRDNKFLSEDDIKALESFKNTDPYYYDVYCLGKWGIIGKTYFNAQKISERLDRLNSPIKKGYFSYTYEKEKIKDYKWIDDPEGFIEIYEDVKDRVPYVLGGDTAGEGSDYFTGFVIDNITGKQVAKLRREFDEVEYTRQIYCLGKYYNEALVGLEANFSTYPIRELERLGYKKQYVREKEDEYTHKLEKRLGVRTDMKTRPVALANLQQIVLEQIDWINDKDTLEEMLTFVRNERGRPEAQEGCHDDLVMGLAITYYIRDQQKFKLLPAKAQPKQQVFGGFNLNVGHPIRDDDFGSRIEVI